LHFALICSIITSVSLIVLFSSSLAVKSDNSYDAGWSVYAEGNSTESTTLPRLPIEALEQQNDNQSNTTSASEQNSTKYIQYEDTNKGFKIDRPQDWKAVSSDLRNNAVIAFNPPDKIVEVDVKLLPRANNMSLKTFGDQYKKVDGFHQSSYFQNATTLLAGQPAIRVEGTVTTAPNFFQQITGQGSTTHKILTMVTPLKQQKFIQVIYFANASKYSDYLPMVEHMLKSFQIINPKPILQKH
jgi:photosystem II reaction center protein PsbP